MDPTVAPVKEKKPPTEAQLAKIQREKNAAERIFKETGVKVPPTVGAKLLKMEREQGNVAGFLTSIRTTGKGLTRKKPTEEKAPATTVPVANKPASTKKVKSAKKAPTAPLVVEPVVVPEVAVVAEAVKEATNSLTNDEQKILSKCGQVYDKLMEKTRKNLRNATGRNASNEDVKRLFNLRKEGHDMPILNYLKLASGLRKVKTTRRGKNIANVAPKVTKKQEQALEAFLKENN